MCTHLPPSVTSMICSRSKAMKLCPSALCQIALASGPLCRSSLLCRSIIRLFFSGSPCRPRATRMPHMAATEQFHLSSSCGLLSANVDKLTQQQQRALVAVIGLCSPILGDYICTVGHAGFLLTDSVVHLMTDP